MDSVKIGYTSSVIFHIFILLLMILVKMSKDLPHIPLSDFIEIISLDEIPFLQESNVNTADDEVGEITTEMVETPSVPVEIPEVVNPDYNNSVDISNMEYKTEKNTDYNQSSIDVSQLQPNMGNQTSTTNTNTSSNTSYQNNELNLGGIAGDIQRETSSFQILGGALKREIRYKILPEFPSEVKENGTVTLSFRVLPNGSIESVTFARGKIEFASAAIDAMKQWIFEPSDQSHNGQISFNFFLDQNE